MSKTKSRRGAYLRTLRKTLTGPLQKLRIRMLAGKRRRSRARFIAVTGSSGKSTTVHVLGAILAGHANVRAQMMRNTVPTLIRTISSLGEQDDFVIAELGVGSVGDMAPMAKLFRPDVAIVTMVGVEHFAAFRGREGVAREKGALLEALRPDGLAILNADDPLVMEMGQRTKARIVTFGTGPEADYRVENIAGAYPETLSFDLIWKGGRLRLVTGMLGHHFWMPVAAAAAAALELGTSPEQLCARLPEIGPVRCRCQLLKAPQGPMFILDTAKAPSATLPLAFDLIAQAKAPYKRIVIGTISDYGGSSSPQYRRAYHRALEIADQVVFVGSSSLRAKPSEEDLASGRYVACATPQEAYEHIRATAREDELILLKGSSNLHLERLALAFLHPVRCWEPSCGVKGNCIACDNFTQVFDRKTYRQRRDRQSWTFRQGRAGR